MSSADPPPAPPPSSEPAAAPQPAETVGTVGTGETTRTAETLGSATETPRADAPAVRLRDELRAGAVTLLALAALGVPAAAIWYLLAPRVVYRVVDGGGVPKDLITQAFVADDGWFFVVSVALGVLCGAAAWAAGRRYAVAVPVGLAAGGLAGAVVAWRLGISFGSGGFHHALRTAPVGTTVRGPLILRAKGTLVAWPVAALVAFVLGVAAESARHRPGAPRSGAEPAPASATTTPPG